MTVTLKFSLRRHEGLEVKKNVQIVFISVESIVFDVYDVNSETPDTG